MPLKGIRLHGLGSKTRELSYALSRSNGSIVYKLISSDQSHLRAALITQEVIMRWEELTGDAFVTAVEQSQGVCLVPLSVVERHGHHLPLGTDTYIGRAVVTRAAAIEPAVVFPDYIFTQIPEARHLPGTIAIDPDVMVQLPC